MSRREQLLQIMEDATNHKTRAELLAEIDKLRRERDEARELAQCFTQVERYTAMEARATAAEAREAELRDTVDSCASLLEVIAEDAQKRSDTAIWSMASVMAEQARALAKEHTGTGGAADG